jgi:sulfur-carrier protein
VSVARIPPTLRAETDGQRLVQIEGATVGELLEHLTTTHPSLRNRLLDADGNLVPFVNLYLDGTDIKASDGLATPTGPNATLLILPAMAGGA